MDFHAQSCPKKVTSGYSWVSQILHLTNTSTLNGGEGEGRGFLRSLKLHYFEYNASTILLSIVGTKSKLNLYALWDVLGATIPSRGWNPAYIPAVESASYHSPINTIWELHDQKRASAATNGLHQAGASTWWPPEATMRLRGCHNGLNIIFHVKHTCLCNLLLAP